MLIQEQKKHCVSGSIEPIWGWRWQFAESHHYWWLDTVSLLWDGVRMTVYGAADTWIPSSLKNKFKTKPSVSKVVCTVIWDRKGVIFLDFLATRRTINSDHYTVMLIKLKVWASRVRPEKKNVFFLQHYNTRPCISLKTMEHIANLGWTALQHHHIAWIWCLLNSICLLQWKTYFIGNVLLAMTLS